MITAVDTNVLIDIFDNDPAFVSASADALRECLREGHVVACDIVWAETSAHFASTRHFVTMMADAGVHFDSLSSEAAALAGDTWRHYRGRGGARVRVIADFMIAAHAQLQCDRLLTRDRGFYRKYFRKLAILDPTA